MVHKPCGRKRFGKRKKKVYFCKRFLYGTQSMNENEYIDKLGKWEERIRALDTAALIEEFQDKHSGNVSLIRLELQQRYKSGRDCAEIAIAFRDSIISDQQWLKNQERKTDKQA